MKGCENVTTIDDIRKAENPFLTATDIAPVIGWSAHFIRLMARQNASALPFPVLVHAKRVQIPKKAFIEWYEREVESK